MILFKQKQFDELNTYELYAIIQLRLEVFVIEQECDYQDCDGKDIQAIHLIGYESDQMVAYCRILPNKISYDGYCSIGRVLTKGSVRGKSYGRKLMDKAIEICEQEFELPIKISAQKYLEKFYSDLDFVTVSDIYFEDEIPHIAMIREKKTK